MTSIDPEQKVELVRKDIMIKATGASFKRTTPLCVVFAKQLETKIHYEDEEEETEKEFLDKQLISVIYAKPNGSSTIQSLRIIKNLDFELHPCSKNLDIKKPFSLVVIEN